MHALLQDDEVHTKYGFLYDNYSRKHPYWETTEMLRKFAIAFIPVSVRLSSAVCFSMC